jgi:hypothetical protein
LNKKKIGLGLVIIWQYYFTRGDSGRSQGAPAMEATLKEARTALDNSDLEEKKLRQIIANLEKQKAKYPKEVRFPMYLAEAYYRLADPDADVAREFPIYEKTEKYARQVLALDPNRAEGHYWNGSFC